MTKCSENIFLFNDEVYQQIDGLSMGSPLAPILANWFVNKVESRLLQDANVKQPKFYWRYVDDIFAIFESTEDRDEFFRLLNSEHKNLEFTMENMDNSKRSLPFLDVEVRFNKSDDIETTVYRKPTNTNVLMHYDAMAPKKMEEIHYQRFSRQSDKKYIIKTVARHRSPTDQRDICGKRLSTKVYRKNNKRIYDGMQDLD